MIIELTRKKLLVLATLIVVVLAVPITLFIMQRPQDNRSGATATPEDTVVVSVNGTDYTKADVRQIAEEQFEPAAVDDIALQDALNVLIERKILDTVAEENNITVDPARVEATELAEGISRDQAYYEVLREDVTLSQVKSMQVESLGFWSPTADYLVNLTESEKDLAAEQSSVGTQALAQIQTGLQNNQNPVTIYNNVSTSFPTIAGALAINGHIAEGLTDEEKEFLAIPTVIQYGDANLDPSVLQGLFAMQEGDVETFAKTETNNGGNVFKVIKVGNQSGPATYQEWFNQEKQSLVLNKGSL